MFKVKMLGDSINAQKVRLTTMELTYPRMIHSEFMTHRLFSRNAASSRAIPISKMIERVKNDPVVPIHWGANEKGMQANSVLDSVSAECCKAEWLNARDQALDTVYMLDDYGLHKQIANRLLEPWMWITVIASATNWSNFFSLRCHEAAEPHINRIAVMAREAYLASDPEPLRDGEWHTPLIGFPGDEELSESDRIKVSVGRCARVSYLTHDGKRDIQADIDLHDRLKGNGHFSPFEHVAQARGGAVAPERTGNYGSGWHQYRKDLAGECQ